MVKLKDKMDNIINEYRDKKDALMLILQSINAVYNYFPENILRYISRELNIPLSEIYRIATFYNAFSLKPKGQNIIKVCMGTACHVSGSDEIIRTVSSRLGIGPGETTEDFEFSVERVACFGSCALAPVVVINDKVYGNMTPQSTLKVLDGLT